MSDSDVRRRIRASWRAAVRVGPRRAPMISAEWLAQQGRAVRVVDLRAVDDYLGPIGHVPGSVQLDAARVAELLGVVPLDAPVVIVDRDGEQAIAASVYLQSIGLPYATALDGGIIGWREAGFAVSHDARDALITADQIAVQGPLTAEEPVTVATITRHIGAPGSVRWVKLAAFMLNGKRSCVDGRDDNGVLGTPGGDAGELLLGLGALEQHLGVHLDEGQIGRLLSQHLDTFGHFYLHTDAHAVHRLADALGRDPRVRSTLPEQDDLSGWQRWLAAPATDEREAVLEHVARREHVGCGHLAMLFAAPEVYGVRHEVSAAFLRAWWRLLWQGAPELEHVVLDGHHAERAVLNVTLHEEIWPFSDIPMVSPADGDVQMFVNHPQVMHFLRRQLARFLVQRVPEARAVDPEALALTIRDLAQTQANATLGALASGLPVFEVRFTADREFTVIEPTAV